MQGKKTLGKNLVLYAGAFGLMLAYIYFIVNYAGLKPVYIAKKQWQPSEAATQGIAETELLKVKDYLESRLLAARSLIIIKNGRTVFEKYFGFGGPDEVAYIHSISNSILSALIGIALEKKLIKSLDQTLLDFFPRYDIEHTDTINGRLTLRDLLLAHGPLMWGDDNKDYWRWFYQQDKIEASLRIISKNRDPATTAVNSAASYLLAKIIEERSSLDIYQFADRYLFRPLGVSTLSEQKQSTTGKFSGFRLKSLDLAKFGYLLLSNGFWEDQPVIPSAWIQESTANHLTDEAISGYGYQWRTELINGCKSYQARGDGGQFLVVLPQLNLVISVTSKSRFPLTPNNGYNKLFSLIVNSGIQKCAYTDADKAYATDVVFDDNRPTFVSTTKVPDDIQEFFEQFAQDLSKHKIEFIAKHYAKGYYQGMHDYKSIIKIWRTRLNSGPVYLEAVGVDKVRIEGNRAYLRGFLKYAFKSIYEDIPGIVPIRNLIKIKGRWKWYGSPKYTAVLDHESYFEAEIPDDLRNFLDECSGTLTGINLADTNRCFVNNFLYNGLNQAELVKLLRPFTEKISTPEIRLTKFEPSAGSFQVDGFIMDSSLGVLRLPPGIKLVKKVNEWRWGG